MLQMYGKPSNQGEGNTDQTGLAVVDMPGQTRLPNTLPTNAENVLCSPCNSRASPPPPETPITPEQASPPNEGFLIDVNLFDYQPQVSPVPIELLNTLQRDQLRSHFELEQRVYDVC